MQEHKISLRYARALLESAKNEGIADKILEDLQKVKATFESSKELQRLVASPVFQTYKKRKILTEIFDEIKISKITLDFIMLLIDKRRGNLILDIISEFETQYNIANNKLPIEVISAIELNENEKQRIIERINQKTKMEVIPKYKIDESLKGGIIVKIDDWVYDASLKNQLKNLFKQLTEN